MLPLLVGLESCAEVAKAVRGLFPAGEPDGLSRVVLDDFARFLVVLEVGIELFEPVVPFGGLFAGLPSAGVSGRNGRFDAYGSAV